MLSSEDCASELQAGLAIIPGLQSSPEGKEDSNGSCHLEMRASSNTTATCLSILSRLRGARISASFEAVAAGESPKPVLPREHPDGRITAPCTIFFVFCRCRTHSKLSHPRILLQSLIYPSCVPTFAAPNAALTYCLASAISQHFRVLADIV
jgi:hypothetical protein